MSDTAFTLLGTGFLALSFLVIGCLLIENDVNYPAWRTLDPASLARHHAAIEAGLRATMFPAMALHLLFGVALLVRPPARLGRPAIVLVLVTFGVVLAVSFAVQVPLHASLGADGSASTLEALIASHRLYRRPLELFALAASLYALHRVVRPDRSGQVGA